MKNKYLFFLLILFSAFLNCSSSHVNNNTNNTENMGAQLNKSFVPEWARKVVWYQIFPERFRNGDTTNDPTIESITGSYPHDESSPWQIHHWNSDWYKLLPYEKKNGKDIWYNLQRRRYGGDIQGIIDKLDYLKDLGIGAIYLNPVFEAPSLHKYDAVTYHHIDPYFGPNPAEDKELMKTETPDDASTWVWTSADKLFLKLIEEVHKREMKIIIDGVFNHMGLNSWAFKDVKEKQQKSKYKDWFTIKNWENTKTEFEYEGWFGVKELPELREDENGIVEGPKKYIFEITSRWMDPNGDGNPSDGIDGWRLDVAYCIKHQFWKDWREHVKTINPDAYITAEIVDSVEVVKPYLRGDEFDAVMNYNFLFACAEYFIDDSTGITTSVFDEKLRELRNAFPDDIAFVQQNLFDSHDTQRILSHIVNKDKYKLRNWGNVFDKTKGSNPVYETRKPTEEEISVLKLMLIFQMTYVGAPYVYYGDEAGMWGANDPDCRKPMVWSDIVYEDERSFPDQKFKPEADKVKFNKELFEFYKKIINIRNKNEVLQIGDFKVLMIDDEKRIYVYQRNYNGKEIIVAINRGNSEQLITLNIEHKEYYSDLLSESPKIFVKDGKLNFPISSYNGCILRKDYYR